MNESEDKARDWAQKHKGRTYTSVANAADGADIVFSCVGNDRDLREVFDAAAATMRKGAIFVDHTTASAAIARELADKAEALGLGFLDAPVSGVQAGAEAGNPGGCVDANGALLLTDQRGYPRTADSDRNGITRCDIGAYETDLELYLPLLRR